MPGKPIIRKGVRGSFHDKGLKSASHHAVIPNCNTINTLHEVWPKLSSDEKKLFDVIARAYLAAVMSDFQYRQTSVTLDVRGIPFNAVGRQPIELGWRSVFPDWKPSSKKGDGPPCSRQCVTGLLLNYITRPLKIERHGQHHVLTKAL